MICIQNKYLLSSEHIRIHSVHVIHLHHILHTATLFRKSDHRCCSLIFQLFYLYFQFIFTQIFTEYIGQSFNRCFICLAILTKLFCKICVNSLELYVLILLLKMRNKLRIDHMFKDYRIFTGLTEHIDVLALLYLICYVIDHCFLRFLILGFLGSFLFCLLFFLILLNTIFQSKIFAIQIFEKDIVVHLFAEFRIFDAAKFDKRTDIIPVFLIRFSVCLAHSSQFIRNFLGNVLGDFLYKTIVLQCGTGYIQWQIRAVDHTFQEKKEFRDHLFDIVCNKYLVIIKFNCSLNGIILCSDLREIQNTFQVKRIIHVQMDPEQWLFVIHKYLTVKLFIFFVCALIRMFHPKRLCIT